MLSPPRYSTGPLAAVVGGRGRRGQGWLRGASPSFALGLALTLTLAVAALAPLDARADIGPAAAPLYAEGRRALHAGEVERAIALLEEARALEPRNVLLALGLVDAYAVRVGQVGPVGKMGLARRIREVLEQSVEAEPRNVEALRGLMQYHLEAPRIAGGSSEEAERLRERIAAVDAAEGRRASAIVLTKRRDLDGAARELRAALAARPDFAEARLDLVLNAQARRAWEEAFAEAERLAAAGDRRGLYQVGRTGALSGERLPRAETALREFLASAPPLAADGPSARREPPADAAWFRLGEILARQPARTAEARAAWQRALELNPGNAGARKALGRG